MPPPAQFAARRQAGLVGSQKATALSNGKPAFEIRSVSKILLQLAYLFLLPPNFPWVPWVPGLKDKSPEGLQGRKGVVLEKAGALSCFAPTPLKLANCFVNIFVSMTDLVLGL